MSQWLKAIGGYAVEQIGVFPPRHFFDRCLSTWNMLTLHRQLFIRDDRFAITSTIVCAPWTDYPRIRWPVLVYMSTAPIIVFYLYPRVG